MKTLHLITGHPDYAQLTALLAPEDEVVILSEAVYHQTSINLELKAANWQKRAKVLSIDCELRGLEETEPKSLITYQDLVDLTLDSERSMTW